MRTIFGFETEGFDPLDEHSFYLYYFSRPGDAGDAEAVATDATQPVGEPALEAHEALAAQLSSHRHAGGAAGRGPFRPNFTVSRAPANRPLEAIVDQRRSEIQARGSFALVSEGQTQVAGCPAHESVYRIALTEPAIVLMQLQVTAVVEGYIYSFVATSTAAGWELDRARSQDLIASFRATTSS